MRSEELIELREMGIIPKDIRTMGQYKGWMKREEKKMRRTMLKHGTKQKI